MERDTVAVFADGHLTSDDGARVATLVRALEDLGERCSAVYILGDLFEIWLGVTATDSARDKVGRALRNLRERGVRTVYVEGNRDFEIGRGATAGLFDQVERVEIVERFGAITFHLSHGDLVNTRDRQYRAWRRFAKGLLAPVGLRLLPSRVAMALADRLETRMRSTNRVHKSYFPREACLAHARDKIERGADIVVVGHFHRYEVIPVESNSRRGTFVSLPFWHAEPRPLLFDSQGTLYD